MRGRKVATKLSDDQKKLKEIGDQLEGAAKTKVHLAPHANRCLESAEHLHEFTSKMNKVLGEVDNKDASEEAQVKMLSPRPGQKPRVFLGGR